METSPQIIDSHAHLDSQEFESDLVGILERATFAGVSNIITIGSGNGFESAQSAVSISHRFSNVFATVGLHPNDAEFPLEIGEISKLADDPRVVAIGETGLDYHWKHASHEKQHAWFELQIALALQKRKPIIIHSRESVADCVKMLKPATDMGLNGVFHCFTGTIDEAKKALDIGFLISFTGIITFKKADLIRDVVKYVPFERIMVETDAPYMAPEPHRGKTCESAYVIETARTVAKVKEVGFEECARTLTKTTRQFFGI